MRVLMISLDATIVVAGRQVPGDTRERHARYAEALRRSFPEGRVDVIVKVPVSWGSRPQRVGDGLRVHPVPCRRAAFALRALRVAHRLVTSERPDVVTTQTPFDDGLAGVWLQRRYGLALNVQMHSSFLDMLPWIRRRPVVYRAFNRLGKWVARRADSIRVVSSGEKARLEQAFPHLKDKLVCLPPLVNRAVFDEPIRLGELEEARVVLQGRGLQDAPFVLFAGRLSMEKNLATLLRTFALVTARVPEGALVIAGNGPLRAGLEKLATTLGIQRRLVWLGALAVQSLRPWYASAVALVLPSFHEGFPRVIPEAYLMETPVLVSPFVSAPELVSDGKTGFIAPDFGDMDWMASRMAYLLRNPEEARVMGRQGRRYIQARLLPEAEYLDRLIGIWRETAAAARRG